MQPVRFVHAADLHLDAAFSGLARDVSPELAERLHEATFTALDRLVALCAEEQPDFLVLAGDTWNQEELSLRAQIALRDACEGLGRLGVRVFLAHGNHDPLSSRFRTLRWPDNVTVFGPTVEAVPVYRPGYGDDILAVVHGVSHVGPKETRNLASWFRRTGDDCPQIGVLHTTFNVGAGSGETPYAPCSPEELAASGLDYWALGHIHEHGVACREPLAIYPGSAQGLHVNEQGPHGCVLVELTPEESSEPADGGGRTAVAASWRFCPLAPAGWKILDADLGVDASSGEKTAPVADMGRLERMIREKMEAAAENVWPGCETLVIRARLTGRTPLDAALRRPAVRDELLDLLRQGGEDGPVRLWIKDLEVDTRPLLDRETAVRREDLLGEVLRRADAWRADPALLSAAAGEALGDLFSRGRSRRVLSEPTGEDLAVLLEEAERLCADLLEND